MDVRPLTPADLPTAEELVRRVGFGDASALGTGELALIAEQEGAVVGVAVAEPTGTIRAFAVAESALGTGAGRELARSLARQLREQGVETLRCSLPVDADEPRTLVERFGFRVEELVFAIGAADLLARLDEPSGPCYGAIYVQTDDEAPLRRALARFVPRLPDADLSGPHNGWIAVTDPQLDADPKLLRRLGRELSIVGDAVVFVLGVEFGGAVRYALLERGSLVDEYLSVPEFHGPLPPGEVVALGANPTAVARLTGANAAAVRALCRTAASPSDLPPADELYRAIAAAVGVAP